MNAIFHYATIAIARVSLAKPAWLREAKQAWLREAKQESRRAERAYLFVRIARFFYIIGERERANLVVQLALLSYVRSSY